VAALGGAGLVGWMWVTTSDSSSLPYRGGFLLSALAVAVVIVAVVQPRAGPLGKFLSLAPLRLLGLISYGVYLWHWPVYQVLTPERTGLDGAALFAVRVALTLAVAAASYTLVEMPIRRGAWRAIRASWAIAPATAAVLAVALVVVTRGGTQPFAVLSDAARESLSASTGDVPAVSGMEASSPPVRVLLVGDSVAWTMAPGLASRQEEQNFVLRDATIIRCGIVGGDVKTRNGLRAPDSDCQGRLDLWRTEVQEFQPDVVVIMSPLWDAEDHEVYGRLVEFDSPEARTYWLSWMQASVDVLSSGGAKVVIISALYFPSDGLAPERTDWLNSIYDEVVRRNPGTVTTVDLNSYLYPTGEFVPYIDGMNVRGDGYHFSQEGADMVGRWLAPRIVSVVREAGDNATESAGLESRR
jgi:lysophospholipase L1-like esterase